MKNNKIDNNLSISQEMIDRFENDFNSGASNKIALNAVSSSGAAKIAVNRQRIHNYPMTFSTDIKTPDITDQKASGRCWIFAALNLFRVSAIKKMNLKDFELSQSYIMFFDKLERANYFLENIIKNIKEDKDSRLMMWLLDCLMEDGGQWSMFVNLVKKYGIVPKEIYPESISSSATNLMNLHINEKLKEYACLMREKYFQNKSIEELRGLKENMLNTIYRILAIHNGIPPKEFHWNYIDKDSKFHSHQTKINPKEFLREYVGVDTSEYVSLINCPTDDKPLNKHYTVEFLGNVAEGDEVSYLNIDIDTIKQSVIKTLKQDEPVWFGCDVGKNLSIDQGILDQEAFNFAELYNTTFNMTKSAMVDYGHTKMTHAMLFTGVHEENNKPARWKVENSWGEKRGKKGFLVMGDKWFDQYVFQVVVPKRVLDDRILQILKEKAIKLKPWDAMGSLA